MPDREDPIERVRQELVEKVLRLWDDPELEPMNEDLDAPLLELRRPTPASGEDSILEDQVEPDVPRPLSREEALRRKVHSLGMRYEEDSPPNDETSAPLLELHRVAPAADDEWSLDSIPDEFASDVRPRRRVADRPHRPRWARP